jgi:hypothetical protein
LAVVADLRFLLLLPRPQSVLATAVVATIFLNPKKNNHSLSFSNNLLSCVRIDSAKFVVLVEQSSFFPPLRLVVKAIRVVKGKTQQQVIRCTSDLLPHLFVEATKIAVEDAIDSVSVLDSDPGVCFELRRFRHFLV